MFDLIKMNIYKVARMKSFYILPIVMALICFIMTAGTYVIRESEVSAAVTNFDIDGITNNISMEDIAEAAESQSDTLVKFFDDNVKYGFLTMLIGIGVSFIVVSDYKSGFIKNYAGQAGPKGIGTIAYLPAAVLEIIFIFAAMLISLILCGYGVYDNFIIGSIPALMKVMGVQLLLCISFSSVIIFFTVLARSSALSIIIAIYLSTSISGYVLKGINFVLQKYLGVPGSFDLKTYALETYFGTATSNAPDKLIAAAVASVVYLVIFSAASFFIVRKRDV